MSSALLLPSFSVFSSGSQEGLPSPYIKNSTQDTSFTTQLKPHTTHVHRQQNRAVRLTRQERGARVSIKLTHTEKPEQTIRTDIYFFILLVAGWGQRSSPCSSPRDVVFFDSSQQENTLYLVSAIPLEHVAFAWYTGWLLVFLGGGSSVCFLYPI